MDMEIFVMNSEAPLLPALAMARRSSRARQSRSLLLLGKMK